jgi:hypothetical protein
MTCSFCGGSCTRSHSKFNAITPNGKALICSNCISYLAVRVALTDTIQMDWRGPDAARLKMEMQCAVVGQPGSTRMRKVAVDLALRICRYSLEIEQSNAPEPLRILVKGGDPDAFFGMLKEAVKRGGIVALKSTVDEHGCGEAEYRLMKMCHNDALMAKHAVIFVKDGPVISDDANALVCVSESDGAIELDGFDEVELS